MGIFKDLTTEEKWDWCAKFMQNLVGDLMKKMVERWGEEGLTAIAEVFREEGRTQAELARKKGLKGNDCLAAAEIITATYDILHFMPEVFEKKREKFSIEICKYDGRCPFHITNPRICDAMFQWEKTLAKTIHPDIEVSYPELIASGGKADNIIFEMKKSS
jgi:hypothetical protein